ncbi:MAG: PhoH family protein [Treponema sp.]|nr:PhoH family protein [Treponema sp.]
MSAYTIVVPDNEALCRICGTNDSNLKLIEDFLGIPIFACGNELSVEENDTDAVRRFRFVIDSILDEIAQGSGELSDSDLIQSVLSGAISHTSPERISSGDHAFFEQNSISVPGATRKVYPRTRGQAALVSMMRKSDIVIAEGPAGSGKTFLCICEALRLLLTHKISCVVLTRPVVEAGESLGYLPGDLNDKLDPYTRPLYDAMNSILHREAVARLQENGMIETAPLAYMRGRTLNSSAIILDEAQNTSPEQMKMFLTRMGDGSKLFITGDLTQVDLPRRVKSGLADAMERLEGLDGISMARLDAEDVVRNPLVKKIIKAYESERHEEF